MLSGPSFALFGAYFPSWMACLFFALIIVIMLRVVFIRVGLDDVLSFRLAAYTAMVIAIASGMAILIYGQ